MSILVVTKENKAFDLDDVTMVQHLHSEPDITFWNIFWIIFWVFMFFPIAIVLLWVYFRKRKYTCAVKFNKSKRVYKFDEVNFHLLESKEYD